MLRAQPRLAALSLMHEEDFRLAAGPLFAEGIVDAVEWSFDTLWGHPIPAWLEGLLDAYGEAGRLFGHGVHYSPLSAAFEARQARWLERLADEVARRPYVHVSEHYGFMTAAPFVRGAPLPMPRSEAVLRVGRDRLRRMRERLRCPLGIENLALAWSRDEALGHGVFLDALLDGLDDDDFVLLDVHNLWCQAVNFELSPDELLATFPRERVRELHVSGGSDLPAWPDERSPRVRCDTHDERVPEPVFEVLERALERFPNVRVVVFERLGGTLPANEHEAFRDDFRRVRRIVEASTPAGACDAPPVDRAPRDRAEPLYDDPDLAALQSSLLVALAEERSEPAMRARIAREPALAPLHDLEPDARALGIAARVVKKWARVS